MIILFRIDLKQPDQTKGTRKSSNSSEVPNESPKSNKSKKFDKRRNKKRINNSEASKKSNKKKINDLLDAYEKLRNKTRTEQVIENIARVAASLATLYWKENLTQDARKYFVIALENYKEIDDKFHVASVRGALGSMYISIEDYDAALHYTEKAFSYWAQKSFLNERLLCLQNLGIIYKNLNNINKAADYVLKALQLAIKLRDENEFAKSIQILLEYYEINEDYQMLRELKLKALEFWRSMKLKARQFKTLIDLGVLDQTLELPERAIDGFKAAFNLAYHLGDLEKMYLAQGFIGEVYFDQRKIKKAKKVYKEVFKLAVYIAHLRTKKNGNFQSKDFERINRSKLVLLSLGLDEPKISKLFNQAADEAKKTKETNS